MSEKKQESPAFDEISCGGVPFFKGKNQEPLYLLLLHNGPHKYWAFPKGRQNEGETYRQTAIREIQEETGIKNFKILKRLISDSIYFPRRGNETIVKKVIFYLVEFFSKKIELSPEHVNWKWVTFEDALSMLTFEDYSRVLKESHEVILDKYS
ncbi:MAG: bis(5'-nucleosyl)-tetraphosphatase [Candidatus Hodarchaeales archaeon]